MKIAKVFRFEASHVLHRHHGKCSRLHGHSFVLEVGVEGPINPETQFVMDYGKLGELVKPIVERFDHQHLNAFIKYPSSENIAIHVAHLLRPSLEHFVRFIIRVSETENTQSLWDSDSPEDLLALEQDVFSDTCEWAAPVVNIITDVDKAKEEIQSLEAMKLNFLKHYEDVSARIIQQRLYTESLTPAEPIRILPDLTAKILTVDDVTDPNFGQKNG